MENPIRSIHGELKLASWNIGTMMGLEAKPVERFKHVMLQVSYPLNVLQSGFSIIWTRDEISNGVSNPLPP